MISLRLEPRRARGRGFAACLSLACAVVLLYPSTAAGQQDSAARAKPDSAAATRAATDSALCTAMKTFVAKNPKVVQRRMMITAAETFPPVLRPAVADVLTQKRELACLESMLLP